LTSARNPDRPTPKRTKSPHAVGSSSVLEVALDAITCNAQELRRAVGPNRRIFAALKANAYGYGLQEVAKAVVAGGADSISLANVSDAVALRRAGMECPILLYPSVPLTEDLGRLIEHERLVPTILDPASARRLARVVAGEQTVFLKVDVGLERLGVSESELVQLATQVSSLPNLRLGGLYTHMHVPLTGNDVMPYLQWQFARFQSAVRALQSISVNVPLSMVVSTAVLQLTNSMTLNALDPGRIFYGMDEGGPGLSGLTLRPALVALRTRLVQVKVISRDEYRELAPFPIRDSMRIGVVPLGSFHGFESFSCGEVLVRGTRARVAGSPSIEHARIDLTDIPAAVAGDEVVIIGTQGSQTISPGEVARQLGLPSAGYLALGIRESVSRAYVTGLADTQSARPSGQPRG